MAPDLRTVMVGTSYLELSNGEPPHPGGVLIHEVHGLNDNIRDICHRIGKQGYAALGVDLFAGWAKPNCLARILLDWLAGRLDCFEGADARASCGNAPTLLVIQRMTPPSAQRSLPNQKVAQLDVRGRVRHVAQAPERTGREPVIAQRFYYSPFSE
jgi:dienelactone hydrolase